MTYILVTKLKITVKNVGNWLIDYLTSENSINLMR